MPIAIATHIRMQGIRDLADDLQEACAQLRYAAKHEDDVKLTAWAEAVSRLAKRLETITHRPIVK